jgi:tetratricopeptide (TPR) repeat protein
MKRHFIHLLLFLIVFQTFSVLAGTSSPPRNKEKKHRKNEQADPKQAAQSVSKLIEAKKEEIVGNEEKAIELFRQYIDKYPADPVAYFELARLLAQKKEVSEAIKLGKEAYKLNPDNVWYALFLAEMDQLTGNIDESITIYRKILEKNPTELDYYYQLAALFLASDRFLEAVEMYNKIEEKAGMSEDISIQKEKIFMHLNQPGRAEQELINLVNSKPEEPRFLSILAEFYMANGQQEKALDTYQKILKIDPGNPYIHMSLADYFRKAGNKEKAFGELKLGFENPNLDIDTKVNILLSFYTINQLVSDLKEQAFILSKILVDVHPNDPKSHSIYGDLLSQDKKYAEAREEFLKAIRIDSSRYAIWEEVMRLDLQLEKFDELAQISNRTIELFPDQPIPYLFAGMADYQLKKYEEAVLTLQRGAKLVVKNDELLAQFYMYLGDAYHAMNNTGESDKAYNKSLDLRDDNAYVLNNYAYYLSVRNESLTKAEAMSKKAVGLDSLNASFQDTYGWVLYRLGKYEEAGKWVEKALQEKGGTSAEVMEHYGDIQFKLGNVPKAVEYWEKAKAKGPGSEFLPRKIADKKIYE